MRFSVFEKKCENCGSTIGVERVHISSITGRVGTKYLCAFCALEEKLKRYEMPGRDVRQ